MPRGRKQSISERETVMTAEIDVAWPSSATSVSSVVMAGDRLKNSRLGKKTVTKKSNMAYGYFLPQLEEFDKWPGIRIWREAVEFENTEGRWTTSLCEADYFSAWNYVNECTRHYLEDTLLPFADYTTEQDDGKHVVLVFVGLHNILSAIASAVRDTFRNQSKTHGIAACSHHSDDEMSFMDVIEEFDIGGMFRGEPALDKRNETQTALNTNQVRLPPMDFETSIEPSSSTRTDFVTGSVDTKRRRTMTPEIEDLTGARLMTGLSLSSTPEKNASLLQSNAESEENPLDFVDLTELSNHELNRDCMVLSSYQNVFGAFSKIVRNHYMQHFPVMEPAAVRAVSRLMDCVLQCELNAESESLRAKDAWSSFKLAFEGSVRFMQVRFF